MRARRERAGLGRHPESTPNITPFLPASSALGAGSQSRQASPAPVLRHQLQRHIPGWKREGRALTCPGLEESWGWGPAGGSAPFPGPRRKGLCGAPAPPPGVGTFLGRGLASSPSPCRGAEARGQGGGGDSQWASVPTHKGPLWPSSWPPYSRPRSPACPAPRSPARRGPCGAEQAALASQTPSLGAGVEVYACTLLGLCPTPARACSAQAFQGEGPGSGRVGTCGPNRVKTEKDRPCRQV